MASHNETVFIADWDEFTRKANYGWLTGDGYRSEKTARREFQTEVLVPALLSYSDYSGSTVERSNERVWAKEFADSENEAWTTVGGGHGTTAVVIRVEAMTDEMREFLDALEDYPVADESDMSELELELQQEAWDNWAAREFKNLALKAATAEAVEMFPDADEGLVEEAVDEAFDNLDKDALFQMFHDAAEAANEYWETETGGDQYIDMKRVVEKGLDAETVVEFLIEQKLLDENVLMSEDAAQLWRARRNPNQLPLKFDGLRGGDTLPQGWRVEPYNEYGALLLIPGPSARDQNTQLVSFHDGRVSFDRPESVPEVVKRKLRAIAARRAA